MTKTDEMSDREYLARRLIDLKFSMEKRRATREALRTMQELGTQGILPKLETNLAELLGEDD